MEGSGKRCPKCGGALERGKFDLICKNCNKEFYDKDISSSEGKQGVKCPVCSSYLAQSPYDPKLYVCSNGNCPSRDKNDTPQTLEYLKIFSNSIKTVGELYNKSLEEHAKEGGRPPKTLEEARTILLVRYPALMPLFRQAKPIKIKKKGEVFIHFLIEELEKRGWSEQKIFSYLNYLRLRRKMERGG